MGQTLLSSKTSTQARLPLRKRGVSLPGEGRTGSAPGIGRVQRGGARSWRDGLVISSGGEPVSLSEFPRAVCPIPYEDDSEGDGPVRSSSGPLSSSAWRGKRLTSEHSRRVTVPSPSIAMNDAPTNTCLGRAARLQQGSSGRSKVRRQLVPPLHTTQQAKPTDRGDGQDDRPTHQLERGQGDTWKVFTAYHHSGERLTEEAEAVSEAGGVPR